MTTITRLPHPAMSDVQLTDVLFALSDPARLEIVRELADGPLSMAECGMTNPALPKSTKSHLMKVLREAGVVRNQPEGRGRLLSLRRAELDERFPGLLDSVLSSTKGQRPRSASSAASTSSRVMPSR